MTKVAFVIELKQSSYLLWYLIIIHSVILMAMMPFPLSWLLRTVLCLFLVISFIFYYRRHYLATGQDHVIELMRLKEASWTIRYGNGHCMTGLLLVQSVVMPKLIILTFKTSALKTARSVCIASDQASHSALHQLRLYCRDPKTFQ